ncbi:MAG: type II CRISPR RNA-guided endonuclease Cas9 [Clostridia bacterium]|nr:type II CRISPR RNA-guided endonuclease Cas9 [Clostridia bacterium]
MKNEKYYVGLDIGTNSIGYAVTGEDYNLCKYKGEHMWGTALFDEAQLAAERRGYRAARRRLDRRQQRVNLVMELFAEEISKVDPDFFKRIKESYFYPASPEEKIRLFDKYDKQKEYVTKYPTIHHLIYELMNNKEMHDVRLVYLACSWLVAHRGHFLNEVDKNNIDAVTDFNVVFKQLTDYIQHDDEYALPWDADVSLEDVEHVLECKSGITNKTKALAGVLFANRKVPKEINNQYEYNYDLVLKLLCGGKVGLKELFGKEEYAELEEKSVSLVWDDEKLAGVMQNIGDDFALISALKAVYDWSVLVDVLKGKTSISEAKVEVYQQHQSDLKILKYFVKKYVADKYSEVFRSKNNKSNYVAYIGKNHTKNEKVKVKKSVSSEEFCKYIVSLLKTVKPTSEDVDNFTSMMLRLEANDFLPKQVDGDNRVIPYQLYWFELNKILENAKEYIPFWGKKDNDGITGAEKVLSVFEFKVPYYVGPLKEKSNPKWNHWMVRKAEGKIYPWNFEDKVDLDASEDAFIKRMTNFCTYLPGEDVLPKHSLVYTSFEVLNEINNIKINGYDIPVDVKMRIYIDIFGRGKKVTLKDIREHLISNNYIGAKDVVSGIDITVQSSLKPFAQFESLVTRGILNNKEVESIIHRATYSEDKVRFAKWLRDKFPNLSENDFKYILSLKFKNFGRLSRKLLLGIEGINKDTGEVFPSIIRAMWETNCNLMQLLSDKFTFAKHIEEFALEYYNLNPKSISERLEDMYVSNAVKRPIIRTIDIVKDVVKVKHCAPERIFIEMARGSNEEQKGKRTKTRLARIYELYEKVKDEDVRHLTKQLEEWGDSAHNKLQSDKLFLYFIQLGKCLYTGDSIDISSVMSGDGSYNIDHIRPRSIVKDDSVINNLVLVDSMENERKGDNPVPGDIVVKMKPYWVHLNKLGLITDEKLKRLTRTTKFTDEEKFEFINRQLVETRQSTKVVATLLKELYPDTDIVYVKSGLVSEFRHQFGMPKSRIINDLHHAKDAYLNIVTGNVWHCKFSRRFWKPEEQNNAKAEIVFARPVICNGKIIWNGSEDKDRVVKNARKNTAHVTMYSFCKHSGQNGGFFDQNPLSAAKDLIPVKKDRLTEFYGGYNRATIAGFVLVKYNDGKKTMVSFVPLRLLDLNKYIADDEYALAYVGRELGEKAQDIEILLNKRILKIYTMLSLDGARYCIRGKETSTDLGMMNMMQFKTSFENEQYIKKLESFNEKRKKNENFLWDETYDGITKEKNSELFSMYIQKLSAWPYNTRPGNKTFVDKLKNHIKDFEELDIYRQVYVLLQILGVLGRAKQADLKDIKESSRSAIMKKSLNFSDWKKDYDDVRIIDQSTSGLYEKVSDNLLELL